MRSDLIYDVGANNGNDTEHYLRRGFRVLAIEANPFLANAVRRRFETEVKDGRLTVLNVGIFERPGAFEFYVNETNDEHSSLDRDAGTRGRAFHKIEVECQTFGSILAKYGTPYYLKIDIERADIHCLREMNPDDLSTYVSVEAQDLEYLGYLQRLGYQQFKVIDQSTLNRPRSNHRESVVGRLASNLNHEWCRVKRHTGWGDNAFPIASSGNFGEDTPGPWRSLDEVAYEWLHVRLSMPRRGTLNPRGWYDFHAKFEPGTII